MMKTSLLRQAAVCRVALAARPLQGAFRSSSAALALSRPSRSTAALYRPATSLLRFYSSESPVSRDDANDSGLVTRFADLSTLGVHPRLVEAITRGMGYENMTTVQSMTINPALGGKDVYVAPAHSLTHSRLIDSPR